MSSLARFLASAATLLGLMGPVACSRPVLELAVLDPADDAALSALRAALAQALGRSSVQLGPYEPGVSTAVTVLPPPPGPLEGNSPALPIVFDLVLRDGACVAVRRDRAQSVVLPGIACRPVVAGD